MSAKKLGLSRLQWILTGALVVQIVLSIVVNVPKKTQATVAPILEGFNITEIAEIEIENQPGDRIHMEKINGKWVLPDFGNYPVQTDKVSGVLGKIKKVKTNRMVTQTDASHSRLKVAEDDYLNSIILRTSGGISYQLFLGSSGGTGATHIRLSGYDQVYLTADLTAWEISPTMSSWIDTSYVNLSQDQIKSLTVENANGTFRFNRMDDGQWTYDGLNKGETFSTDTLETTINQLASMRMVEPIGTEEDPSMGLENPTANVMFEVKDVTESTSQLSISIGGEVEGNYAVKASSSPYYVKIAPTLAKTLIEMDHSGLLVKEPTPTATP